MKFFAVLIVFFVHAIIFYCNAQDETPQNINKMLNNQAVVSR